MSYMGLCPFLSMLMQMRCGLSGPLCPWCGSLNKTWFARMVFMSSNVNHPSPAPVCYHHGWNRGVTVALFPVDVESHFEPSVVIY